MYPRTITTLLDCQLHSSIFAVFCFPDSPSFLKKDSILKSRDITLPTKDYLVKAMVFPVIMYGCESWTIKKTAAVAAAKLLQSFRLCTTA